MKTFKYCNNCGKQGHTYYTCKKPIISLGILPFTIYEGTLRYLMICRKDSFGYVEFIRGKYPLYDKMYILNIIDEMSIIEKNKLLENDFDFLWHDLWGQFPAPQYKNEEEVARNKFEQLKRGILDNDNYSLETLIKSSKTTWLNPEWGFPKGRRNYQENDIPAALREFQEETGISSDVIDIVQNIIPFEEIFVGSNFRAYKHKYYLAYINPEIMDEKLNYQKSEVSKIKWMSLEQSVNCIRPSDEGRCKLLKNVNNILIKYNKILI